MSTPNLILQRIATSGKAAIQAQLVPVQIDARERFQRRRPGRARNIYFPAGAVISLLYGSGAVQLDVFAVGREGVLSGEGVFGQQIAGCDLVCQIGGTMLQMPARTFEALSETDSAFRRAMDGYQRHAVSGIVQSAICNALHSIAQRTARALLVCSDRTGGAAFEMTHELLARMLGVGRSGVSIAIEAMQDKSIVRSRAGSIIILRRDLLTCLACDCYPSHK